MILKHNSKIINLGSALLQSCSPCQQEMHQALHGLRNMTARAHAAGKPAVPCLARQHIPLPPQAPAPCQPLGLLHGKHTFKMPPEQLGTGPGASQTNFLLLSLCPQTKHTPVFHQAANPLFPLGAKILYYFFKTRVLHTPSQLGNRKS